MRTVFRRRKLVSPMALVCLIATIAMTCRAADSTGPRPNILLIVADDLGRSDVGFMGSTEMKTPHLDQLARNGAILDSFYVQPVCSPTRACLMTGRYATRTGVYQVVRPGAKWGLPLGERTLATALREAGYATAICGKWHLGEFEPAYRPTHRGFDQQYGHWFGALDYFTHTRDGKHDWHRNDQPSPDQGYSTHLLAKEACRLIREKKAGQPLFLYLPFNAVHAPHEVPASYRAPFAHLKGVRQTMAAMISTMDEAVGQVIAALEEKGVRDQTLIIFTSDNGGPNPGRVTDNGRLRAGKGTIYEGGIRVCAFAHWPGKIKSGTVIKEPMHAVDWFPTLVKLAGGSLEQKPPLDGLDIWPVLTRGAKSPHDALLLVGSSPATAAVRAGDWKLLVNGAESGPDAAGNETPSARRIQPGPLELYNLAEDPGEQKNLASAEPARVAALRARLDAFLKGAVPPGNRN